MIKSQVGDLARRQLANYDAHCPGRVFEDAAVSMTIAEAYEVQMQVAALRAARGEPVAGYKVGCVSDAVQRQLGLNRPVFGCLFASEIYRSGAIIDSGAFDCLAIEAEFAARIAVDIPDAAWLREHPERSIAAFFPVIELHNHVFRGATRTAQELIANNALARRRCAPRHRGFAARCRRAQQRTDLGLAQRRTVGDRARQLGSRRAFLLPIESG
jgi:2-keto-4-pentenoate hydratase